MDTSRHPMIPEPRDIRSATPERQVLIGSIGRTLQRGKWPIIGATLLGGLLAGLAGLTKPAVYGASTQILIHLPENASDIAVASAIDDHLTMLASPTHLRRVLASLDEGMQAPPAEEGTVFSSLLAVFGPVVTWAEEVKARLNPNAPDPSVPVEGIDTDRLENLRRALDVEREMQSRVITVGVRSEDPYESADLANAFVAVYLDELSSRNRGSDERELAAITAGLSIVEDQLIEAIRELETHRLSTGAGDASEVDDAVREMSQLERQRADAKAALNAGNARIARLRELQDAGASETSLAEARGRADGSVGSIDAELARLVAQVPVYESQLQFIQDRAAALSAAASDTAGNLAYLGALQEQVKTASRQYDEMLTRKSLLIQRLQSPSTGVTVLSPAWPPTEPMGLSPIFLVPPGMILGGLLGALVVLYRSERDRTLRGEAECQAALGVPCAGLLPQLEPPASDLARLIASSESGYGRAARMLLMSLRASGAGFRLPQVILVTSTAPEEGKPELAWTVAFAATGFRTRVAFLDLAEQPDSITTALQAGDIAGLPDKNGGGPASHGAVPHADRRLDYISAAAQPTWAMKKLAEGQRADEAFRALRDRYDLVVVNAMTCLEGPEVRILSAHADLVLFAVGWGKTSRDLASSAITRVRVGDVPLMAVLTNVDLRKHAGYGFGDSGDLLEAPLPSGRDIPQQTGSGMETNNG